MTTGGTHHQIPPSKWAMNFDASGYTRPWAGVTGEHRTPIIVDCRHPQGDDHAYLCLICTNDLQAVLSDIPALLFDLDVAIVQDTRFVQHGTQTGRPKPRHDPDDDSKGGAPLGFNDRASTARIRLTQALHAAVADRLAIPDTPAAIARQLHRSVNRIRYHQHIADLARDITAAVARAHKVIDAPPSLWYYGTCPLCGHDIYQQRIHHSDDQTRVTCTYPSCDYTARPIDHNRKQLDAGDDRWMTVGELVAAITAAEEVVTRDQINGWIRRDGLPREERALTQWVDGRLVSKPVWVYRLGDVRRRALEAENRKNPTGVVY